MKHFAYLFAAKGIQRFILEGGKLKDMVGASELVASLCSSDEQDLLRDVLAASGFAPSGKFSRRAGGVFMLHFTEQEMRAFEHFRALWTLAVSLCAPGLEFVDTCKEGNDFKTAKDAAYDASLGLRRNGVGSLLPMAGPFVRRAQRTGLAAVAIAQIVGEEPEALDTVTLAKRRMEKQRAVTSRFEPCSEDLPEAMRGPAKNWLWPADLEKDFPFNGGKRWIGVVHADISGLGRLWQGFDGDAVACFQRSKDIEKAMTMAAQWASGQVLAKTALEYGGMMPARAIILGGDDLTILVRADLAIDYADAFLRKLEEYKVAEMKLTACAGVAFIKSSQPFHMASRLAEDLCKFAKSHVKDGRNPGDPIPSALAFHRVTSSLTGNFDAILAQERTVGNGGPRHILSRQPYLTGGIEKPSLARLEDLKKLKDWIGGKSISIGPLRNLQSFLFNDLPAAEKAYRRWRDGMAEKLRREGSDFSGFDKHLNVLLDGASLKDLPFDAKFHSPLFDALDWRELA